MKTKLFTLLLAVAASVGTMQASNTQVDGIWYDFDSSTKTASVTFRGQQSSSYSNEYSGSVVIPSSVTYRSVTYSVTSIGNSAFQDCSGLASVTIPNSVTSIGGRAFSGCSGLTSIVVENGNSVYDSRNNCNAIIETATNTLIAGCQNTIIPNSVTSIGEYAFYGCTGLTSIEIPNNVTSIGGWAFQNCSSLTSVVWNAKNYSNCDYRHTPFYHDGYVSNHSYDSNRRFDLRSQITSFTFGNEVEHIPAYLCNDMSNLTSVTIPNSVTSIGGSAFSGCSGLTSVTIGNSVTSIGESAFQNCSGLTSVTLNSNAIVSKNYSKDSNLKTIFGGQVTEYIIGDDVTSIGNYAFSDCIGLTSVTIGNSVTSIGESAFNGCSIGTINFTGSIENWCNKKWSPVSIFNNLKYKLKINGVLQENVVIPNSVTSIGDNAFRSCSSLTSVVIPNSVTSIGSSAFQNCSSLTSVTIPNSVTSIGNSAFNGCSIGTINFTGSIENWCDKEWSPVSISNNYKLKINGVLQENVVIPNSVTSIGDNAFRSCSSLTSVTIGNSVTSIGDGAFWNCSSLTSVTIPNSVTSIGSSAFQNCSSLTSMTIPNSVTSIGERAFSGCSGLTGELIIPNSVTSIGNSAFRSCRGLTSVVIPNSVTSIGDRAFSGCSGLTSVVIPNSVTSIGDNAFRSCSSLTSVTIGNSVTSIGDGAFQDCSGLASVTIPNSVTSIGSAAFANCSGLTSVTIPNSVTSIGERAFYQCSGLTSVTIPNSVTSIGESAFNGCSGLTSVTIGNSVTSIGSSAFQNCSSLTSVTIPNSVTSIGESAFNGCSGLTSVTIGNSVTSIGESAFNGCSGLTSVILNSNAIVSKDYSYNSNLKSIFGGQVTEYIIGDDVTSIGRYAFQGCSGMTSVVIPNSVTSIGSDAFAYCSSLTCVTIPNSVTSIGEDAFWDCSGLTSVTIGSSVTSIGSGAFWYCSNITIVVWNAKNGPSYNFGNQVTSFTFGNEVEIIPAELCKGMTNLTSVIWNAKNCSNSGNFGTQVESFVLGDSVEVIPDDLCKDMSKLSKIEIPKSVVRIGNNAFKDCGNDGNLVLPASLKTIGDYAFKGWTKTKKIDIPNNVTKIGAHAFDSCYLATSVYLGSSVEEIGDYAFKGCVRVNEITSMNTNAPIAFENTLTSISANAYLYVPAGSKRSYQIDPYWSRFNIYEIAAEESSLTKDAVTVEANDDNAIFTWPTNTEAASYTLQITKDGVVFCTLVFNSNGQLTGIAFAPSRNGASHAPAATMSVAGMSFTVTGLNGASRYFYTLETKDANGQIIKTYTGMFATEGYVVPVFTITFVNYDGTQLQSGEIAEGEIPQYTGVTPTKPEDEQNTYTFSGWTPEIVAVTENATYTATFTATAKVKYYTITFVNYDGTQLQSGEIAEGEIPQYTGSTPTKASTAQYTYTFSGWTPTIAKVTANATYTATFTQTLRKYTITWKNADGTTLKTEQVDYGTTPSYTGFTPTKESTAQYDYTFAGWTPAVAIVTQAATYTATYTSALREYLVTFLNDDNTVISSKNYKYGETPIAPADPVKQNTAEYTYTFNGWDNAIAQVQGPQTYKATFTASKNSYTITWQDENGSLIDQTIVEYGQIPAHADPVKLNTAEYTYTFAGWTPAVVAVTGDATYKATFTATKNSYTITWQDENGSLIDQTTVEYGQIPAHAEPTKQATAEYTYTFAGWTPTVVAVTGNATYRATFSATKNKYLITFRNDDGTVLKSEEVEYGMLPIAPATPTKESTAQYNYEFAGWTPSVTLVSQAVTYTATYNSSVREYLVTFLNDDNSIISMQSCKYGSYPTIPSTPTKQATAEFSYTFAGWTPNIVAVSGDVTYKATFNATRNSYTITWQDENGALIDQTAVEYGQIPAHADPVKQNTAEYTYTFAGWTPAVVAVTGDATYKATFTATKNSYTITWQNEDGSLIDQTTVEYGQIPAHADPVKQNTAEYTYTFAGWTPAVVAVTGDATYKATFTATKNSYTITWLDEDGSLIDKTTVEYGVVPTHAEPTKEATEEYTYTFSGWTPAVVAVTGDATYKATFNSVVNVYTISVSAVNGQVIGGGEYQYGATIDLTAIPNEGYVFDQWSDGVKDNPRTITVTGDAEYTALFTSTEGFENIYTSEPVQKVIIDQKVYILRGEKVYTLQGQETIVP